MIYPTKAPPFDHILQPQFWQRKVSDFIHFKDQIYMYITNNTPTVSKTHPDVSLYPDAPLPVSTFRQRGDRTHSDVSLYPNAPRPYRRLAVGGKVALVVCPPAVSTFSRRGGRWIYTPFADPLQQQHYVCIPLLKLGTNDYGKLESWWFYRALLRKKIHDFGVQKLGPSSEHPN